MSNSSFTHLSQLPTNQRDIKKVPFVELFNGRLQGVVSSGSDIQRVYVAFFEAGSLEYYCSTNNNRPCGGLRGAPCNHLQAVLKEAEVRYGIEQVVRFLRVPGEFSQIKTVGDILPRCTSPKQESAGDVFSRFLNYLRYVELDTSNLPLPEMSWFI